MLVDLYKIFFRKTLADFYHLDTGAVTSTRLPTGKHTPLYEITPAPAAPAPGDRYVITLRGP